MLLNENNSMPYMKSLATCVNRMVKEGYTEDFKITERGLESLNKQKNYSPDQIQIVNFFRFEGMSDPDDNAVLYVIETADGTKGTLIDAYGIYNDTRIGHFIKDVERVQRKVTKH
jgi:pantothenate synthetase